MKPKSWGTCLQALLTWMAGCFVYFRSPELRLKVGITMHVKMRKQDSIEIDILMIAFLQLGIPKFEFYRELAGP